MDDFVGSGAVLSKERVKELSKRRNGPGSIYLLSHFGAIGISTYALFVTQGTWCCIPFFSCKAPLSFFCMRPNMNATTLPRLQSAG